MGESGGRAKTGEKCARAGIVGRASAHDDTNHRRVCEQACMAERGRSFALVLF